MSILFKSSSVKFVQNLMHYQKENEEIDIYKFLNKLNWHLSIHLKIRPEKKPILFLLPAKKKKKKAKPILYLNSIIYICNKGTYY